MTPQDDDPRPPGWPRAFYRIESALPYLMALLVAAFLWWLLGRAALAFLVALAS